MAISDLRKVFSVLRGDGQKLKLSKCEFAQPSMCCLGHMLFAVGVAVNPQKIRCIQDWPQPKTLKALHDFLVITGYYRKFVHHYGLLAKPLTGMLKHNGFSWSPSSAQAFTSLKQALATTLILALPDFTRPFVLECHASNTIIDVVLSQNHHLIAYLTSLFLCEINPCPHTKRKCWPSFLRWRNSSCTSSFPTSKSSLTTKPCTTFMINVLPNPHSTNGSPCFLATITPLNTELGV
ncbi:hypothetical protein L3X38_033235 [Prunus dulcis]|uniref:Reverse transcriptase/retrotransposon-derived protein RNase H-like domain-containing protein n=1 Tax=Prunus dulcis TaxID=3755 RepID=A0AAD4VH83_PRUDU|nr:hypothetical protein L3X38_033235 [Prunus dulcis]